MALQGSLDTFALADVLRLLASTKKTGCLRVDGDRGTGNVWVDAGALVDAEASVARAGEAADVLFELLRFDTGSFAFDAEGAAPSDTRPLDMEAVLAEAEAQLTEWAELERTLPSTGTWVALVEDLPEPEVTIDAAGWRVIGAIGAGATVAEVVERLGRGELSACRGIVALVEAGLARTEDEAPESHVVAEPEPVVSYELELPPLDLPEEGEPTPFAEQDWQVAKPAYLRAEDAIRQLSRPEQELEEPAPVEDAEPEPVAEELEPEVEEVPEPEPVAEEPSVPEPDPEPVAEDEEPQIDRGRLLRFLGSVRS